MGKHPKLDEFDKLFATNADFSITEEQYKEMTEADLPKENYYIKNKSALAKKASENGYCIEIQERTIILRKKA